MQTKTVVGSGYTALIIVDVQKDFCKRGALEVPDGDAVVPYINMMSGDEAYARKYASRDCHPPDTEHFKIWPVHCVQDTPGAQFHPQLDLTDTTIITKGQSQIDDGYSAFEGVTTDGVPLEQDLRANNVTNLDVVGLATDYCVKATAIDGAKRGFNVTVYLSSCRAANIKPDDGTNAIRAMEAAGVTIVRD
ncbi:MAG: isochorismatase family protein [Patescibacteria group bacterium]